MPSFLRAPQGRTWLGQNNAGVLPPEVVSATISTSGDQLTVVFDGNVTFSTEVEGVFILEMSGGPIIPGFQMGYVSGDGTSTLIYDLPRVILSSETGTLGSMEDPALLENPITGDPVAYFEDFAVTNSSSVTVDTFPPELYQASLQSDGETLLIRFNEYVQLGADGITGLVVSASGGAVTLSSPSVINEDIEVSLSRIIDVAETLFLSYTQPGDGIKDTAASPTNLANFTGEAIGNGSEQDVDPPEFFSATIQSNGTVIFIAFNKFLDIGVGGSAGFVLNMTVGDPVGLVFSSNLGDVLVYTLDRVITDEEVATLDYVQPGNGIESATAGNDVASFSDETVTNNSTVEPDEDAPGFSTALSRTSVTSTSVTIGGASDEDGEVSVILTSTSASQPSDGAFDASGDTDTISADVPFAINVTGLTAGSLYKAWVQIKDESDNRTTSSINVLLPHAGSSAFVQLTSVNSTAANRLTSSPVDLAIGDFIDVVNVAGTGTVVINNDGTFDHDAGVTSFDYYVGNETDEEGYGTNATQSIDADETPDSFTFTDQTGIALSTQVESNIVTITGIDDGIDISIDGGEYRINGGTYTSSPGTIDNGDTVQLRVTSSGSFATGVDVDLTIGTESDTWSVTTLASDSTPDAFSFTDQTDVARSTQFQSNIITVSGINTTASISIDSGEYRINGGTYTSSSGTVSNGDTVQLRRTSSGSFSAAVNSQITIGGVSDTWTLTTLAQDTTPDAFAFTDVTDADPSEVVQSNIITVAGINDAAAISVTGAEYRINGGAYTSSSGTVNNGDTVQLRLTASASYETLVSATLTIGGVSDQWDVTTIEEGDTTPNPFTFTDQTNLELSTLAVSNQITVSGISAAAAISVTGGQYSLNGGSYTSSPGTVNNGDTVTVRGTTSDEYETQVDVVLDIDGVTDTFSITTRAESSIISIGGDNVISPGEQVVIASLGINFANVKQIVLDDGTATYPIKPTGTSTVRIPNYVPAGTYTLRVRQY